MALRFEPMWTLLPNFHFSPSQQNLQDEFENTKHIVTLIDSSRPESDAVKTECEARIARLEPQIKSRWAILSELASFLQLFWIMQQFLLAGPHDQVQMQFMRLTDNLGRVPEKERESWGNKKLKFMESLLGAASDSTEPFSYPRRELYALRKFLDERVAVAIWRSCFAKVCLLFLGPLLLALVLSAALGLTFDKLEFPGIWFCIAFTTIGAVLSSVISCYSDVSKSGPPSMDEYAKVFCRPIIGMVAGVFLFALAHVGIIQGSATSIYAAAVAFGFSERLFIGILERYGDGVAKKLGERAP